MPCHLRYPGFHGRGLKEHEVHLVHASSAQRHPSERYCLGEKNRKGIGRVRFSYMALNEKGPVGIPTLLVYIFKRDYAKFLMYSTYFVSSSFTRFLMMIKPIRFGTDIAKIIASEKAITAPRLAEDPMMTIRQKRIL